MIGVVDSGIAPESPAFAEVPGLGVDPEGFAGACAEGDGWAADDCTRKIVGARWYVDGFGADRVRSSESLSPRDALGHGTQVSSVAAGNAGVSVRVDDRDAGHFGGVAPQARVAAYKACWGAPDPADDGCSTADVVSAVDAAVADGVDVLSLALAGGDCIDTLQRASLGAAEADIVVIGAAGNAGRSAYAAHARAVGHHRRLAVGRMSRGRVVRSPGGPLSTAAGGPPRCAAAPCSRAGRGAPARRGARPRSAGSGRSTPAWSPTHRGLPSAAASAASTSPRRSPRPVAARMVLVNRPPRLRDRRLPLRAHRPPAAPTVAPSAAGSPATPGTRVRLSRVAGAPATRRTAPVERRRRPARDVGQAGRGGRRRRRPRCAARSPPAATWGVFSGSSAATAHASGLAALVARRARLVGLGGPVARSRRRPARSPAPRCWSRAPAPSRAAHPPPTSRSTSLTRAVAPRAAPATPSRGSTRPRS